MNRLPLFLSICSLGFGVGLLGGCGGNSESETSNESDAPPPVVKVQPLDPVVAELEGSGFNCVPGGGTEKGLVQWVDCNDVDIIAWDSPKAAARYEVAVKPLADKDPTGAMYAIDGTTTMYAGSEKALSAAERSDFNQVRTTVEAN